MAMINNLSGLDAAIRAACPAIDGVSADGKIWFQSSATQTQIDAAHAASMAFLDTAAPSRRIAPPITAVPNPSWP